MKKNIQDQINRYNSEAAQHADHYNDKYTQKYRDEFIRSSLFRENLNGKYILDAMCASGIETGYLINKGAIVIGLDISKKNVDEYKKRWHRNCYLGSIHKTPFSNNTFDAIYICGGLHHVIPLLNETITEIHRILKPGGFFYFVEPNKDTWVNYIRRIWYRLDKKFTDDEEAISYKKTLSPYLSLGFKEKSVHYGGSIAYLLIGQSLTLAINKKLKKYLSPISFFIERFFNKIPFTPKLFFTAVWTKYH